MQLACFLLYKKTPCNPLFTKYSVDGFMKFVISVIFFLNTQETRRHAGRCQTASYHHVMISLPHFCVLHCCERSQKGFFHCLCRLPPSPFFDGPARRYVHDPVSRHLAKPRHRNQLKPHSTNCEIVRFWLITFNLFYSVAGLFGSAINGESVTLGHGVESGFDYFPK